MWISTVSAALIGAHVQKSAGFRLRDVRFMTELFWNWQAVSFNPSALKIHNNQIKRAMEDLVAESWATAEGRGKQRKFRLTRAGLLGIIGRLRAQGLDGSFEVFLFVRYFFASYAEPISTLVQKSGAPMPLSFRNEVSELFSTQTLVNERVARTKRQIRYLKDRSAEAAQTVKLAREKLAAGEALPSIVKSIEHMLPYELNPQKPLSEVLGETPEELQKYELTEGNRMRIELLWANYMILLESQIKALDR